MSEPSTPEEAELADAAMAALNRLTKWRSFYAGWQLGTRPKGDPESDAVRDLQEARLLLRCEVSALAGLLIRKGIFTSVEWTEQLLIEAEALSAMLAERYAGVRATDDGLTLDARAAETMRGWKP